MFKGVIEKIGFTKMLVFILSIFFFFSIISTLLLYKNLYTPLGPHFAAAHMIVTELQDSLLLRTVAINIIFYLISATGVLLLGVLYSHRIAGPFIKVTRFAELIGKGRFDQRIHFRKKDAIHSLSAALNEMAKTYEGRCNKLSSNLDELGQRLNSLKSPYDNREQRDENIKKILELDKVISEDYRELIL
ncbi:MAG: hypothetical protein GXP56_15210 [Deltaproteobacteria bacterium]|nr:hypothetical protein [Deltaproteobacteria bacterium]